MMRAKKEISQLVDMSGLFLFHRKIISRKFVKGGNIFSIFDFSCFNVASRKNNSSRKEGSMEPPQ